VLAGFWSLMSGTLVVAAFNALSQLFARRRTCQFRRMRTKAVPAGFESAGFPWIYG